MLRFLSLLAFSLPFFVLIDGKSLSKDPITSLTLFQQLHKQPPPPLRSPFNRKAVETAWFTANLDNFNETDTRTWQMRYLSNDEFFENDGPLFIYIGGEWEITDDWITGGHTYDMARHHHGYLVYTEHRYYGESRPTP